MALVPYTKRNNELGRLHREMDDLFSSFFSDWPLASHSNTAWPALEVCNEENQLTVQAELPGCKPEEIDISVHNNVLTIRGEKKQQQEKKEKGMYHSERVYGSFSRQISLPADVDNEKVDASYKDGILSITMPKSEKAKPHKIKVKS